MNFHLVNGRRLTGLAAILALATSLTGCNLTGFMDSPSGDEQNLSRARACLDDGDFACAREYYAKLSGAYADAKNSELAFTLLEENGAGMGNFVSAFGKGGTGGPLTAMANDLATTVGAGAVGLARRTQLVTAFGYATPALISDPGLRNLVKLTAALGIAAEILAEASLTKGDLRQSDVAVTARFATAVGGASFNTITAGNFGGAIPTVEMLYAAINDANTALSALNASGKFASTSSFASQLADPLLDPSTVGGGPQAAFLSLLTSLEVGRL